MHFLTAISNALWGTPTVAALSAFGLYFTARLGFYKPTRIAGALRQTFFAPSKKSAGGNLSSFAALATALGGTVGVGSISGVALAISVGGAGSIFWMWLCSFLGLGLKYAETAIAHSNRVQTKRGFSGGAMYCLKRMGKSVPAYAFAVLTVLSAAAGGSIVQAGALSLAVGEAIRGKLLCALVVALSVAAVISGGRRYISAFNTVALPLASSAFAFLCAAVIVRNYATIPAVLMRIFKEAFGIRQAVGGISVTAMMRVGCARGTFSNEAGMGSSPISYCAGNEESSHIQGLWGVGEVIIDSFVVSTLTALCILCTDADSVLTVFSNSYGAAGKVFYLVAVSVFAFAAIVSWCFYGEEAMYFLAPRGGVPIKIFKLAVTVFAFVGALLPESKAFAAADIWGALMLVPNLYLLFKKRRDIIELAKQKR